MNMQSAPIVSFSQGLVKMLCGIRKSAAASLLFCTIGTVTAEEVRYVQQNGITYRETRRTVHEPAADVVWEDQRRTVYREQFTTEMRDTVRTTYVPVTQYQYELRRPGWWNPFREPELAYHLVPRSHWEARTETVRVPLTYREYVPETQVVRVPVRSLRFVEQEKIDRVAVSPPAPAMPMPTNSIAPNVAPAIPAPSQPAASIANRSPLGGVLRLDSDPPRYGTSVPAGGTIRR